MSARDPIGLVVVLKDEVHDVAGWLAWHVAMGFDTIFVIDDGSTDGTDLIVQAAARLFDIRYSKAAQDYSYFYDRQQSEYRKKLVELRQEFSWLCFLDADEYLMLYADPDISAFLERFPDAGGFGLNWCLHGNNGHVLRPFVPAPMAYPKRSSPALEVNRHVKSVVRPGSVGNNWANVHYFDIDPSLYVNALGESIRWSSTLGIINDTPHFDIAHIMHFQNRSMEHFIERATKRRDTFIDTRTWSNDDWNKEEREIPSKHLDSMIEALARIEHEVNGELASTLYAHICRPNFGPDHGSSEESQSRPLPSVHSVETHLGTFLQLDPRTNIIVHDEADSDGLLPLFLIQFSGSCSDALLVTPMRRDKPLRLLASRQAAIVIRFDVVPVAGGHVALRVPETFLFLAAEPAGMPDGGRRVVANRRSVSAWEQLRLIPASSEKLDRAILEMADSYISVSSGEIDMRKVEAWLKPCDGFARSSLLQTVLRKMNKDDHLRLVARLAGIVPAELLSGSSYS